MRRRIALLVAATTSVVLLAFLLPLAVLVSRAASSNAVSAATARSQVVVSAVASGATAAELAEVTAQLAQAGLTVEVRAVPRDAAPRTTVTRTTGGAALIRQPVVVDGRTRVVDTVVSRDQLRHGVARAWLVLGVLGLVLIALSLVVADRLARTFIGPIGDLGAAAHRLARGDLGARVSPAGPDEVRQVGHALNVLATRIGELLTSERETVADLSHRLRTPITALRLGVENLPAGPDRDALNRAIDEVTRQVDDLIREARRPVREGVEARCDAVAVVTERIAFWRVLAEDQDRAVATALPAGPLWVRCASSDLAAALDALLENVLAHTPEGTAFSVAIRQTPGGGAEVVVSDEGPGFSDLAVVGRGESRAGSTGLGLDIARRTAAAAGGELLVGHGATGGGEIRLVLGSPGR